jgi:hypothetical protein
MVSFFLLKADEVSTFPSLSFLDLPPPPIIKMSVADIKLSDGSGHPAIGYGTYKVRASKRKERQRERASETPFLRSFFRSFVLSSRLDLCQAAPVAQPRL